MKAIQDKQTKTHRLTSTLDKSIKIEQLWPEAFKNGCTCSPVAVFGMAPYPYTRKIIKRAYLKRSDGVCKDITVQEYIDYFQSLLKENVHNLFKKKVVLV